LSAHGVIGSAPWFRLRARLAGAEHRIKVGIYEFAPGTSISGILHAMTTGDAARVRLTLPSGGTLFDLARATSAELGMSRDSLLHAATDAALRERHHITAATVEGWLLP